MKAVMCSTCGDASRKQIGVKDGVVDVYAFRGGSGLESAFQLGVAHAHIVSPDLPAPQVLVGLSTGAVHATAIADILQAPAQLDEADRADPTSCRAASLNRFREILHAYQDFANDLPGALPDAFEADAGRPLKPNSQAIHFKAERDARQQALNARSGLIALFNDLFRQQITIRTLTRLTRAGLGIAAAGELPGRTKVITGVHECWLFLIAVVSAPRQCGQLAMSIIHAWFGGTARVLGDEVRRWQVSRWQPRIFKAVLCFVFKHLEGRHGLGYTAGEIVFSSKRPRIAPNLVLFFFSAASLGLIVILFALELALTEPKFFFFFVAPLVTAVIGYEVYALRANLLALIDEWNSADWKDRILAYYDLRPDLGNDSLVQDLLIRLFDPTYHGVIDMADVAERAMRARDTAHAATPGHEPRRFSAFETCKHNPMRVVPFVADLAAENTTMTEMGGERVVDGLRAAIASIPFLRPVTDKDEEHFYVDGSNVSADATSPAIDMLRLHLHPEVKKVRIFSVIPVTSREAEATKPAMGTVDAAMAGLELSRYRDIHTERNVVELYNTVIPDHSLLPERLGPGVERALVCFGDDAKREPQHYLRAEIVPIEPSFSLGTTGDFLKATSKTQRGEAMTRAVAEGCHATLQARLGRGKLSCPDILARSSDDAPGAIEICRHCIAAPRAVQKPTAPAPPLAAADTVPAAATPETTTPPRWTPTVSLLFSGGVFRGVFQVGVLNALNELGVKPDVIAGSSVGSIVAAMIARVFTSENRDYEIARLASTFMTLDRLIITDRLADFMRRFTLRAAAARFSLRDTDAFFRNYDVQMSEFGSIARRVVGGIEHLFYVSPFKLSAIVRAFRLQKYAKARDLIAAYAQEICDRGLVGAEILGAEPLALLIRQHVLSSAQRDRHAHAITLNQLSGDALTLLFTATNLTTRNLEIFKSTATGEERTALIEVLLASSAFPGIFRPRWSREVLIDDNTTHQYIDGGVLDNLPITAVIDHLLEAAGRSEVLPRPQNAPHLVLTASLEPELEVVNRHTAARFGRSWMAARSRANRLKYNQKIDRFAKIQRDLRFIIKQYGSVAQKQPIGRDTLDIEVLVIKPKWLCKTIAFHPMLGFRRRKQAASIAHGCAATFSSFAKILKDETGNRDWVAEWTDPAKAADLLLTNDAVAMVPRTRTDGICHFRATEKCPFAYDMLNARVPNEVMRDYVKHKVSAIYRACGEPRTHRANYS